MSNRQRALRWNASHNNHGQAITILVLVLLFFVIIVLGLFAFEVNRVAQGERQLKHACDAAALAGEAAFVGDDEADKNKRFELAKAAALDVFRKNAVYADSLVEAKEVGQFNKNIEGRQSEVRITAVDPTDLSEVDPTSEKAQAIKVQGNFGSVPAFGRFVGIGKYAIESRSIAALPSLDFVIAFDASASIDDSTRVTFVRRSWRIPPEDLAALDALKPRLSQREYESRRAELGRNKGFIVYDIVRQGSINSCLSVPVRGSAENGLPPQNLNTASQPTNGRPCLWAFNLRGQTNKPPGNFPGACPTVSEKDYTDLVVNITAQTKSSTGSFGLFGPQVFAPVSAGGKNFPNVATLVEAQRGNLESKALFDDSKASTRTRDLFAQVTPSSGYQAAYRNAAKLHSQPLGAAVEACTDLVQSLSRSRPDTRFGLVSFETEVTPASGDDVTISTLSEFNTTPERIRRDRPVSFVLPGAPLTQGEDGAKKVIDSLNRIIPLRGTNTAAALSNARQMLKDNRQGGIPRRQVILLFTDGVPFFLTDPPITPLPAVDNDAESQARDVAKLCNDDSIAIFTVGLPQNQEIKKRMRSLLTDEDPSGGEPGGIAFLSGNGARYFEVPDKDKLRSTFMQIARSLVGLIE